MWNRSIATGVAWNLAGTALPLAAAIVAIPVLIRSIGCDRFGVLTIAWAVLGYFSMFNLGLGRTTTQQLVDARERRPEQIGSILWSSLTAHAVLGVLAGLLLASAATPLAEHWLPLDPQVAAEAVWAFRWLGLSVPVVLLSLFARAALEARQRFDLINLTQIPASLAIYLGPLAVLPWTSSLAWVVFAVTLGRLATLCILLVAASSQWAELRSFRRPEWVIVRTMLGPGLWMTATTTAPLWFAAIDRLLAGRFVSAEAIGYYATPYEVVTKLWILSASLMAVLFPRFTQLQAHDPGACRRLFWQSAAGLALFAAPATAALAASSHLLLSAWLGAPFADEAAPVLRWLALGVFINIVAQTPATFLQSIGRSDLAGKVHLAECIVYVPIAWVMATHWGLVGIACAWTLRAWIDAGVLFVLTRRFLTEPDAAPLPRRARRRRPESAASLPGP